nr:hypothetical protein Iba_chr14eCG8610 [Ipomoea batatas]
MPALNHSNMYSKTTLLRLRAQKRGKRREDGTEVSKSQELETLICLVHVSLLQREYVYLAGGTTSVQRLKVRAPLNDVTNVRPSKAQCTTKVGKNEVICYNNLQKAIPLRATSSTPNLQTLSNGSTVMDTTNHQVRQSLTSSMAVDFCRNLEQDFATVQRSTVIGNTNHQVSQTSRYKIGVDLSRNLEAEFETVQGGGQTLSDRTTHQQSQCPIPNISDDLGRNLQAEADTNLPIRRSQRLTFQKGKAVVNSQQLIIDNIQNDKVVSMSALTGK